MRCPLRFGLSLWVLTNLRRTRAKPQATSKHPKWSNRHLRIRGAMTMTARAVWAPGSLPLVGHLVPLLRDRLQFLRSLPAHGDLVWIRVGPWKALVVTGEEASRHLLLDDRTFDKGGP